jgi:hypothetical protein
MCLLIVDMEPSEKLMLISQNLGFFYNLLINIKTIISEKHREILTV